MVHTLDALWTHWPVLPGLTCLGLPADTGKLLHKSAIHRGRSERACCIQGIQLRGKLWKHCVEMVAMAFGTSVTLKSFLLQNSVTGVTSRACSRNVNSCFSTKCHHRGYIKFSNTAGWVKPLELL